MATPEEILDSAGIEAVGTLIITCVDPAYPVSSLGARYERYDVAYTSGEHALGGHVQLAPADATQVFLRYIEAARSFGRIDQEAVHSNLPQGVIQIALLEDGTAVMGIPGDALAFNPAGPGFAFGRPRVAPPFAAKEVLQALLARGAGGVTLMVHPNCGAYAHSVGKRHPFAMKVGAGFMGSEYQRAEARDKAPGAAYVRLLSGTVPVEVISPPYRERLPAILEALWAQFTATQPRGRAGHDYPCDSWECFRFNH